MTLFCIHRVLHVHLTLFNFLHFAGATRTNEAKELMFARQYIVTVAKAFKLQAIDLVYIDYKGKEILLSISYTLNGCVKL